MKVLLTAILIFSVPFIARADVKVGDSVTFLTTKRDLNGNVSASEKRVQVIDIKDTQVYLETFTFGLSRGAAWHPISDKDGETFLNFSKSDLGKVCHVKTARGAVVEVQVPAGRFIACYVPAQFIDHHAHYSVDTFVETWYGPVLNTVIKSIVSRNYGFGQSSNAEAVLKAIN